MKPTEEHKYEDPRLKELFQALPSEEMPERLRAAIIERAAARPGERRRRSDALGMVWAGVAMTGIAGCTILLLRNSDIKFTLPEIKAGPATPIWLAAAAGALALLVIDTLLRRRIRNKEHKVDL